MTFNANIKGMGCKSKIRILIDDYNTGKEIGSCEVGADDAIVSAVIENVTGRHAIYFIVEDSYKGPFNGMFQGRQLFELVSFVFSK
jgi:hypothetical protein